MSYRKNVFVLGAGFSADAGAPIMNDFLRCAMELRYDPASSLTEYDRQIFNRVIEYRFALNRSLAKILVDLDNIEQLFGFMEMDLQLSTNAEAQRRSDMRYMIARTLEVSTLWQTFEKLFNPYFKKRIVTFSEDRTHTHTFIPNIQSMTRQEIDATNLNSDFVRR